MVLYILTLWGNVSDAAESFRASESFLHAIVKLTRKKNNPIYRYVVYLSARKYPCSNLSALAIKETKEMRNVTGGSFSFFLPLTSKWTSPKTDIACESAEHVCKQLNRNYQGIFVDFLKRDPSNNYQTEHTRVSNQCCLMACFLMTSSPQVSKHVKIRKPFHKTDSP